MGPTETRVGWKERVSLPDWGIVGLPAKLDTGARTSAIHVENLIESDEKTIEFDVVLSRKHHHRRVRVRTPWVRRAKIRSSSGEVQERFVVATTMELGNIRKTIELSLVSRQRMLCRMLLGRSALASDFFVDSAAKYLIQP